MSRASYNKQYIPVTPTTAIPRKVMSDYGETYRFKRGEPDVRLCNLYFNNRQGPHHKGVDIIKLRRSYGNINVPIKHKHTIAKAR